MRVGIDVGGTFTDAAFAAEGGTLDVLKVPTTPDAPERGVNGAFAHSGIEPAAAERFVHGTTIVTNLLIERSGGRVALVTTSGFEDVLEMQAGDKPNTFDISWSKPETFVPRPRRLGVRERIDWAGKVLLPLERAEIARLLARLRELDFDAAAVCLLNAHANGTHERSLADAIREAFPGVHCCVSSEVDPGVREYERTSTTALNAYAMPALTAYVLDRENDWGDVHYMSSNGGAVESGVAAKLPIGLAFSGPAGGVVGALALSDQAGYGDLITFDMGGTSTDVAIVRSGRAEVRKSMDVAWGIPYRFPSLDIKSVGAGGGSVLWVDSGGALRVGPHSAGVDPGPACYGRGGTDATVTDVNLLLGLLPGASLGYGSIVIERAASEAAVRELAEALETPPDEVAFGAWRIVNANMAQAIREVTIYKGTDPRDFSLFCFGSAAAQHALAVARELRIGRTIIPAAASVFSGVGLLCARIEVFGSRSVDARLGSLFADQRSLGCVLGLEQALRQTHRAESLVEQVWILECRHVGQTHTLDIPFDSTDDEATVRERFLSEHARLYGVRGETDIEVVNARLSLMAPAPPFDSWRPVRRASVETNGASEQDVWMEKGPVAIVDRGDLESGASEKGPTLIADPSSTIYVPGDARWSMDEYGSIVIDIEG